MIQEAVKQELESAIEKYGYFHSLHEAESVLREEVEEVSENVELMVNIHRRFFEFIKEKDEEKALILLHRLREKAIETIEEAVQVAAMCDKAIMMMKGR
jgi:hypothetical protein